MSKDYKMLRKVEVNDKPEKGKAGQSNKFYEMIWEGGSDFTVHYGRTESTSTTISYPYSKWHSKYREKVEKGYKDVTDLVQVQVTEIKKDDTKVAIATGDNKVDEFLKLMKAYTDNLVSTTYSVKAVDVSQAQVDTAQGIIDLLTKGSLSKDVTNETLMQLYMVIPRKMRNVRDHLLPNIDLKKTLQDEQDNLDAMAAQVKQAIQKVCTNTKKGKKKEQNLLDILGITMKTGKPNADIQYLLNQHHGRKVEAIFEVNKPTEDANIADWMKDKKNKTTKILIHGTRCSSVVPILEQGLKIRPSGNYQFSGKAYGDGNYFSEVMNKSLNYTGHDRDSILLVYEVHTGNPFVYDGWYKGNSFSLTLKELSSRGFDSTYVKAGNGLLNSEIIAYSEKQNALRYIIWLK